MLKECVAPNTCGFSCVEARSSCANCHENGIVCSWQILSGLKTPPALDQPEPDLYSMKSKKTKCPSCGRYAALAYRLNLNCSSSDWPSALCQKLLLVLLKQNHVISIPHVRYSDITPVAALQCNLAEFRSAIFYKCNWRYAVNCSVRIWTASLI